MLCAHDKPDALLDQPAASHLSSAASSFDFLEPSSRSDALGRLGHYEVLEVVGRGGMGIVLKAFDSKLHRVVALKVLAPILSMSALARHRFVREARAAAAVTHEHITAIHAVEDAGPYPYLVMQFLQGCNLQDQLDQSGPLPVMEVVRIGMQIALGLAAAHREGLIHRDIKPANILLENGSQRVKITDFGLAYAVDADGLMQSFLIAGTPAFMSPEQSDGRAIDCRSDLFSLGSVLYALCVGKPPFGGDTPMAILKRVCEDTPPPLRELNPKTPAWLEAIITKLLAKRPEDRYSSADEVATILGRCFTDLQAGLEPGRKRDPERGKSRASLRRGLIRVGAVLLCVALGWAIRSVVQNRESSPSHVLKSDVEPANSSEPRVLNPIQTLKRHTGRVRVVAYSPNGKMLATAGQDCMIRLWDTTTWQLREIPTPHLGEIIWLAFDPSGTRLATGSDANDDSHVRLWDVSKLEAIGTLGGQSEGILGACWSPDGTRIAAGGWDKTLRVWEVGKGTEVFAVEGVAKRFVRGLAYSPKGDQIVTGGSGSVTQLWDANTGQGIPSELPNDLCPTFLPTGDGIVGWDYERGRVVVCDLPSGKIRASWRAYPSLIEGLAVSPDGRFVATVGEDIARLWALEDHREVTTLVGHQGTIYTAAFSPDGTHLATGGFDDSTVRIWELPPACRVQK
ncbi:MAG: serine/threonine-protein kinase [Gemmataceae bacterium]